MIEIIFIILFMLLVLILAIQAKKLLYANEYTQSIETEINTFDKNFKAIKELDVVSDFKLDSGNLYE